MINRHFLTRALAVPADISGGGAVAVTYPLRVSDALSVRNLGLVITVCHFPPGTSKWNAIEHRMFSFISKNWRGRPLDSLATIVNLIAHTTTEGAVTDGFAASRANGYRQLHPDCPGRPTGQERRPARVR